VLWLYGPVHDENITREDTGIHHRFTFNPYKIGCGWMLDAKFVEV
jgi:hypothetical protein